MNPGNTGCCGGPFGVAVANNGNVIVSDNGTSLRYAFHDVDGQTPASALHTSPSTSGVIAYATAGGQAYGAENGHFVQFNNDGTVNHVLTGVTTSPDLGMWGNPVNGHILASSGAGLIDIDPLANGGLGSFRVVTASGNGDGVSVSPDGLTVYSEQGNINGYSIATGAMTFSAGGFNSPDGTGVITSTNSLNGQIIVANNNGELDLLDPVTKHFVAIATGGTRLDYTSPDPTNGTVFIDSSDIVYRLSCGPDCGLGSSAPPGVPEPSTESLAALSLVGVLVLRRFRRVSKLTARTGCEIMA